MLSMRKSLVKTKLNNVKVIFSVDSDSCVNLLDDLRFKEIQLIILSKNKIKLLKSKVRLHEYASESPIPLDSVMPC